MWSTARFRRFFNTFELLHGHAGKPRPSTPQRLAPNALLRSFSQWLGLA